MKTTAEDQLILSGALNSVTVSNIETVTGGGGSDTIVNSGAGAATLFGKGGFNAITVGTGADTVVIDNLGHFQPHHSQ